MLIPVEDREDAESALKYSVRQIGLFLVPFIACSWPKPPCDYLGTSVPQLHPTILD